MQSMQIAQYPSEHCIFLEQDKELAAFDRLICENDF